MSGKKKLLIGLGLIILIAVMAVLNLKKSSGKAVEVTVTEVKRGDIVKTVSGAGYVQPETDVRISARISAEITSIHVREGDQVKKGQLLVELDRQRYEALAARAESAVMSAEASLKRAKADYDRVKGLFDQHLVSQAELDAAEAERLLAESQLRQAKAGLDEALDNIRKTRITAPMDGIVSKINKEKGEIAVGSDFQADPIMTIADLDRMEVLAEIDENDVVLVSLDDPARIEVDALSDTVLEGRVTEIAHEATTRNRGTQEQVTNFEVKVGILTKHPKLRPGMSCTVDITTETRHDVLYIPIQCVTTRSEKEKKAGKPEKKEKEEAGTASPSSQKDEKKQKEEEKQVVFVVEGGKVKMVEVKTGISDEANIEIISGLEEGQKVVSGSFRAISRDLKDGSPIKIKQEGKSDKAKKSE
ncbi:MAG: efflux RND transporter periplasmic adaptor subunit [candidate division KSB1 bacterium]|nr:efflux RND transporter periplasmic adaptor subunit [candidate division KSB1 bacterium]